MNKILQVTFLLCFSMYMKAQNYTSFRTGNNSDTLTFPKGGVCLMGGATEDDEAMKWFLNRASGGDVLVLRATGSNGYNSYLYTTLGITLNSVETIVCNNINASNDSYLKQRIQQAEAIWFAGGDQWTYISYWRNNAIDSLINDAIKNRHIVIGGTSAGMAIQGKYYFSAQNGSVTSTVALANPFDSFVTVDSSSFIKNKFLENVITDTHYDNPDRRGRQVVFMSRMLSDYGINPKGIACDEYTAVCIDTLGIAHVYGGFPAYDDNAYFIQTNCEVQNNVPETLLNSSPLTWNKNGNAIKVYTIKGTSTGNNTFNLNDWQTGSGGTWENWSVANGLLQTSASSFPDCNIGLQENRNIFLSIFPNPSSQGFVNITAQGLSEVIVTDITGKIVLNNLVENKTSPYILNLSNLGNGLYIVNAKTTKGIVIDKLILTK